MAAVETAEATDRRIVGDGRVPELLWREWLRALRPPVLSLDDVLTASQRLVVVSPHPDDEVLACGGLVAMHAQRGGETLVVGVTDGEASHRGDPAWPAARLAAARRSEREFGLARLGLDAGSVTRLALPDGGVAGRRSALATGLRAVLRPNDFAITTWRMDGHPDHDAAGDETAKVCDELGCPVLEAPVWMWHWSAPNDPRVPWHRLRVLPLPRVAMAAKAAALAEHASQLAERHGEAPVLGPAIRARSARDAEYFLI